MATLKSKNTELLAIEDKIPAGEISGDIQVAYDEYVSAAALVAGDIIETAITLPKGRRIYQMIVASPTGGGTVSVGTKATPAKYVSASAAAAKTLHNVVADPISVLEENLVLTIGGTPASAGKYQIVVYHCKV